MYIKQLKIIGGIGKNGQAEGVGELDLAMGDVISIVGPTGSGKTTLIDDIAVFADCNTPTKRRVLINGNRAPEEFFDDPSKNPVAFITQHTNFLSDLPVHEFLGIHAGIRGRQNIPLVIEETIDFANQLTGEPVNPENAMTELSGGQTRALLIADAVIIGSSPIILLDEIENAGIHRTKALELLKKYEKIFIFVTHDPRIALLSDFRVAMQYGAMTKVIHADPEELLVAEEIKKLDDLIIHFRKLIRDGQQLNRSHLTGNKT
jgi:ABC-type lipoprotein export system ATPase subunit